MNKSILILSLAGAVLTMGCADITEKEARRGWGATTSALTTGTVEVSQTANAGEILVVHDCIEGGTADFMGQYDQGLGTFDFVVTFDACTVDGVTVNGDLNYAHHLEPSPDFFFNYTYDGDLRWTGRVEGRCEIDLMGLVEVDASTGDWAVEHRGTVCGHEADAVL